MHKEYFLQLEFQLFYKLSAAETTPGAPFKGSDEWNTGFVQHYSLNLGIIVLEPYPKFSAYEYSFSTLYLHIKKDLEDAFYSKWYHSLQAYST